MKKRSARFFIWVVLIVVLFSAGYLGGIATVVPPSSANTTAKVGECESDECEKISSWHSSGFCVDSPGSNTGCDAKFNWWFGRHGCDTYICGEE